MVLRVWIISAIVAVPPMQSTPEKTQYDGVGTLNFFKDDAEHHVPVVQFLKPESPTIGPASHDERIQWSDWFWDRMFPDEHARLHRNISTGYWTDHFVGLGSRSQIFASIAATITRKTGHKVTLPPTHSMTELSATRRGLLKTLPASHGPQHLYDDIRRRLPGDVLESLKAMKPHGKSLLVSKKHANTKMCALVSQSFTERRAECCSAPCELCGSLCPTICKPIDGTPEWWSGCSAGVPCVDCSQMNQLNPGDAGRAVSASHTFYEERSCANEDLIFVECTRKSNAAAQLKRACPSYDVKRCFLDGKMTGDSYPRPRMTAVALHPRVGLVRELEPYLQRAGATPPFPLAGFFDSTAEEHAVQLEHLAQKRVVPVSGELSYEDTWMPSQRAYFQEYLEYFDRRISQGYMLPTDTKIDDLDHTPRASWGRAVADTGNNNMLSAITHGTIVNCDTKQQMTCFDLARIHTWPTTKNQIEQVNGLFDFMDCIKKKIITPSDLMALIGDGWVLRTIGSFLMFILGNMEFKEQHRPVIALTPSPPRRKRQRPTTPGSPDSVLTITISSDSESEMVSSG